MSDYYTPEAEPWYHDPSLAPEYAYDSDGLVAGHLLERVRDDQLRYGQFDQPQRYRHTGLFSEEPGIRIIPDLTVNNYETFASVLAQQHLVNQQIAQDDLSENLFAARPCVTDSHQATYWRAATDHAQKKTEYERDLIAAAKQGQDFGLSPEVYFGTRADAQFCTDFLAYMAGRGYPLAEDIRTFASQRQKEKDVQQAELEVRSLAQTALSSVYIESMRLYSRRRVGDIAVNQVVKGYEVPGQPPVHLGQDGLLRFKATAGLVPPPFPPLPKLFGLGTSVELIPHEQKRGKGVAYTIREARSNSPKRALIDLAIRAS